MSQFAISCTWRTAVGENSEAYYFPNKFTRYFREKYSNPGVYRWRIMRLPGEQKETVYIGEAENIVRRIQRVLTPSRKPKKGDTNNRLNKIFSDCVAAGRRIVFDIADVDPFEINGIRFGRDTLGDHFKRCAIENILLVMTGAEPQWELLNVVVDPAEKALEALQRLPPHIVREIVRKYSPKPRN